MKTTRILWAAAILAAWTMTQTTAWGWTLGDLNPFHKKESKQKPPNRVNKPSPLKKLDTDTKKFFSKVKETLTPKKRAVRKSPLKPRLPWVRNSKPQRKYAPKKSSWPMSFFRRVEPLPPQSVDEWLSLESPKP